MPKCPPRQPAPLSEHWNDLQSLTRKALAEVWQRAFDRPIPTKLFRQIAIPLLAYRLQELRFGGLSAEAERHLTSVLPLATGSKPSRAPRRRLKAGTRLLRTWQGRTHTVTVADPGFVYDGTTYGSLSVIARKITGSSWSGPAFFGLNERPTVIGARR